MGAEQILNTQVAGIKYTWRTENELDWQQIPNNTYFFDISSQKIYYKNNIGNCIGVYENPHKEIVFIESISDFPEPVAGVITLESGKTYYILTEVDLQGNRLVCDGVLTLLGSSSETSSLTSTGLPNNLPLLTSTYSIPIKHLTFRDIHTAIYIDDNGGLNAPLAIDWLGVNFLNVPNIGEIGTLDNFIFQVGAFLNSKGLKFTGTIGTIGFESSVFQGDGEEGNIIEVTETADIFRRFRIIYSALVAFGDTNAIHINENATIGTEAYILDNVNFSGGSTYISGVQAQNNKSLFKQCAGIPNTDSIGNMFMKFNSTQTVITTQGDSYPMTGTTEINDTSLRFEHDETNNALIYVGALKKTFVVNCTLTIAPASNNQKYAIYIGLNKGGTIDPIADKIVESEIHINTSQSGITDTIAVHALVDLEEGDRVYVIIQNITGTANATIEFMNMIIK